jgi:hypothetical protein
VSAPAVPGSAPEHPLWNKEVPDRYHDLVRNLEVIGKVIGTVYLLMAAWKVATVLNPPLKVKQDMAVAAVKRAFSRPGAAGLPELSNADRRAIHDFTREGLI